MVCWDTIPLDRILDTRLWKHYLPTTTVVGGKNVSYDTCKLSTALPKQTINVSSIYLLINFARVATFECLKFLLKYRELFNCCFSISKVVQKYGVVEIYHGVSSANKKKRHYLLVGRTLNVILTRLWLFHCPRMSIEFRFFSKITINGLRLVVIGYKSNTYWSSIAACS